MAASGNDLALNLLGLILLINMNLSQQNVISVKRSNDSDSIDVQPEKGALFCTNHESAKKLCSDKYDAVFSGQSGVSCTCDCGVFRPTFYSKQSKCVTNQDIIDDNSCSINIKQSTSSLPFLDTSVSKLRQLELDDSLPKDCSRVEATWYYYQHNQWKSGTPNVFHVVAKQTKNTITDLFGSLNTSKKSWVLQVSSSLLSPYRGQLIKVKLQCVFDDGFNPGPKCMIFKALGTHYVVLAPSTTAPPSTTKPSTSTPTKPRTTLSSTARKTLRTETEMITDKAVSSTASTIPTTTSSSPTKDTYSASNSRIWIVFVAGGVTFLVVLALSGVVILLLLRRRRKMKQKKETIRLACTRPSERLPVDGNMASPPHDYEYVVYPVLTEGYQPPDSNILDNSSFGRGPDNELIIRTPGVSSDSLKSRITNSSTKSTSSLPSSSTVAKHEYAYLQDTKDGIYQPLIRPHTPEVTEPKGDDSDQQQQRQYLELIHGDTDEKDNPEYMVLEPMDPTDNQNV